METTLSVLLAVGIVLGVILWRRERESRARAILERTRELEGLRKQHEQAVASEQARQEALFNGMVEGIALVDDRQIVQFANEALRRLFNIATPVQGRSVMEVFRRHDLQELLSRARAERTAATQFEFPGSPDRLIEVSATWIATAPGERLAAVLTFHDVTRLRQLERLGRDFVANVTHELRTPLSMVKAAAETLGNGALAEPEAAGRFLQIIFRHTDRLSFLIEDLLALSELESAKIAFNRSSVSLQAVVGRVIGDLQNQAQARSISLRNEVPPDIAVWADADRLQQVFSNLVDNAIKHGRAEGHIEVGAKLVEGDMAQAWVKDDGPGIPAEAVERVFERFFRIDPARSRERGGTGLGLAIVKHLVLAHGGRVWCESVLAQGATFRLTLPTQPILSKTSQ